MNYNLDCPNFLLDNIEYLKDNPSLEDLQAIEREGLTPRKIIFDFIDAVKQHDKETKLKMFDFIKEYEAVNLFVMQDIDGKNSFVEISKSWKTEKLAEKFQKTPTQKKRAELEAMVSLLSSRVSRDKRNKQARAELKTARAELVEFIKSCRS